MRSAKAAWAVFLLYNVFLFYFSLLPGNELPPLVLDIQDKILHASGYFLLMFIASHVFFRAAIPGICERPYFWGFWYCANIGAVTEILQHYVPGRSTDFFDLLADTAGAALAALILRKWRPDKRFS